MVRSPPPRGPSRAGVSGFQPVVKPTPVQRARAALTPLRLAFLAGGLVLAGIGSFFLDTAFPESIETTGDAEARRAGQAALEKMAALAGGVEQLRSIGVLNAHVEDRWSGMFASLSPWSAREARFDLATLPVGPGYHARMTFADGVTWGYNGEIWIDGGDVTPTPMRRARLYTREMPRLLLAPFAALVEGSPAELIAPGVISVRFRDPSRSTLTTEWRFYVDTASGRLQAIALPFSGADPSPLSVCRVSGWIKTDGVELPEGYDCTMSNRAHIPLNQMRFTGLANSAPLPQQFTAPRVGTTLTSSTAHKGP